MLRCHIINLVLKLSYIFLTCLYKFLHTNKKCTFFKNIKSVEVKNVKENIVIESISGCEINWNDVKITILNDIEFSRNLAKW